MAAWNPVINEAGIPETTISKVIEVAPKACLMELFKAVA